MDDDTDRARREMIDRCEAIELARDLGGVDLDRTRRTIGFERRPLTADRRPRTGPAWGPAPRDWE